MQADRSIDQPVVAANKDQAARMRRTVLGLIIMVVVIYGGFIVMMTWR